MHTGLVASASSSSVPPLKRPHAVAPKRWSSSAMFAVSTLVGSTNGSDSISPRTTSCARFKVDDTCLAERTISGGAGFVDLLGMCEHRTVSQNVRRDGADV